jgi:hypothetical protein
VPCPRASKSRLPDPGRHAHETKDAQSLTARASSRLIAVLLGVLVSEPVALRLHQVLQQQVVVPTLSPTLHFVGPFVLRREPAATLLLPDHVPRRQLRGDTTERGLAGKRRCQVCRWPAAGIVNLNSPDLWTLAIDSRYRPSRC